MEPISSATQALTAAKSLHAAVRALQDAVLATKRNGKVMQEIARGVCISVPMLERLLAKAVLSNDKSIDKAFTIAINAVVDEMLAARKVVFAWLLKNQATRLMSAVDMQKALEAVHRSLVDNLDHIQRLQVDDVYHRVAGIERGVDQVNRKVDTVLTEVGKLQQGVGGVQQGLASLQAAQQQASSQQQAAVQAVVAQLQGLLQERPGQQSLEGIKLMAKAAKERASKMGQYLWGHEVSTTVSSMAWSPDGSKLATGAVGTYGSAIVWDSSTGQLLHVLDYIHPVTALAWSPDGSTLATATDRHDGSVRLWDGSTVQQLHLLKGVDTENCGLHAVAWSPDGCTLAAGCSDLTAILWDSSTGQKLHVLAGHNGDVIAVAWSPDGRTLATCGGIIARLWDCSSWQQLQVLQGHKQDITALAWSPDGSTLATASSDTTARLWDSSSGQQLKVLRGSAPVSGIVWSPDGSTLATRYCFVYVPKGNTTTPLRPIILWDGRTGQLLKELHGHGTTEVSSLAWSPDSRTLAAAFKGRTVIDGNVMPGHVMLWDCGSGQQLQVFDYTHGTVHTLAWSPDGRTLATARGGIVMLVDTTVKR